MVYDSLRGRSGDCLISIANKNINKYGTIDSSKTDYGFLNVDELNKFQNWEYWHKDGGIAKIISRYYSTPPSGSAKIDSARVDTVPTNSIADTVVTTKVISKGQLQGFTFALLANKLSFPK